MSDWLRRTIPEPKALRDIEAAREEPRKVSKQEMEKWAREKAREILREQQDDIPVRNAAPEPASTCESIISSSPVETVMSIKVAKLSFDDTLLVVQDIFASVKFRHLPIVDETGGIIGIISDRDFLRTVSPFFGTINEQKRDKEIMSRKVGTIMTRSPVCAGRQTTVLDAIKLMNAKKVSCLPVVEDDGKTIAGIVTWKDVVRAFCPAGFNRASDSNRMRTDAIVKPSSGESARSQAQTAAADSARLRARHSVRDNAPSVSARLAARVRASATGDAPPANETGAGGNPAPDKETPS